MNKKEIHRNIVEQVKRSPTITAAIVKEMNKLRQSKKGYSLYLGGFSFLGEGSGPFAQGDDKDPERRAEVTGELVFAGHFPTLEEAEEAGEAAISTEGYNGLYADNYVIPEAANMRIIEG